MPRIHQIERSGHTILVVDDDHVLRSSVSALLRRDGHHVLEASSGPEALTLLEQQDVHLMLLDYFMPGMSGEAVVRAVRSREHELQTLQIVLQTGYASERPPRQMLRELDIQGYHDKSEGPDKLLVWVDVALKTYRNVRALQSSRDGLRHMLRASPEMYRLQPINALLSGILIQLRGLLAFGDVCLATIGRHPVQGAAGDRRAPNDSLLVTGEPFELRAGTGRFHQQSWHELGLMERSSVQQAARTGEISLEPFTTIPLRAGSRVIGVMLAELRPAHEDLQLLEIFAGQAAMAIENIRLFELATTDELTGLYNRRWWDLRLAESLEAEEARRSTLEHQGPGTGVLIIDIDHFKKVNDTHGHAAGDQALRQVAQVLKSSLRESDVSGRWGGEELVVLLPCTSAEHTLEVSERIRSAIEHNVIHWNGKEIHLTASIGAAHTSAGSTFPGTGLNPVEDGEESIEFEPSESGSSQASGAMKRSEQHAAQLMSQADQALYEAKRQGRNRVCIAKSWAGKLAGLQEQT